MKRLRMPRKLEMSTSLITCFLRDLSLESATKPSEEALPFEERIIAVKLAQLKLEIRPQNLRKLLNGSKMKVFNSCACS